MTEKIREFINNENTINEQSQDYEEIIHNLLFNSIEHWSKRVIMDIYNKYSTSIFESNKLNIVSNESTIERVIISSLQKQGHNISSLSNSDMIYKAFNFIKPSNLLPSFNEKLELVKQLGITESGKKDMYVINPYFFGFKISFDIYINSLFCSEFSPNIEQRLLNILTNKYGIKYNEIYQLVSKTANDYANQGQINGDTEDETLILGLKTISGIDNETILIKYIYESAILTATQNRNTLEKNK